MSAPWLTILALVPLVGSIIVMLIPKGSSTLAKQVALVFALATLVLTIAVGLQFQISSAEPFQFVESYPWIPALGISYSLGVDGIALTLIALSATLVPVVIISGWNDADTSDKGVRGYFALILALETCMILVFAATDVFLFYVVFEVMLIPVYFLIGRFGGPDRSKAAIKFLLYSLAGGLLMLAALIGLYVVSGQDTGVGTFAFSQLVGLDIDPGVEKLLFLGFFIAFAIKAPLWPFHTWLPTAAQEATPATAILLIGVLDKVGTFGMIRYLLPIFPGASEYFAPLVIALSVISILYGALVAFGQTDMRRLFAYSSMSHFGFIVLGVFVFTSYSLSGSSIYMVAHGLSTALVFITAGYLMVRNNGTGLISRYGGVAKPAPILAGFLLFAAMASVALPALASFVGEFLVLLGTFSRYIAVGVVATLGIVITAAYALKYYQKVATGPTPEFLSRMPDLGAREVTALVPMMLLTIVLGVYPAPVLNVVNSTVERTMQAVGMTDPSPVIPPSEGSAP